MNYFSRALEQWRLSRKLAAGFLLLMLFAVGVSLLNMQAQKELIAQIQLLNDKDLLGVSNARAAQVQYSVIGRELRQALLVGPSTARVEALKIVSDADVRLVNELTELRGRLSGIGLPTYVLDIPGGFGKVPIGPGYVEVNDGAYQITDWQGRRHRYSDPA